MITQGVLTKPLRAVGEFFAMAFDALLLTFRRPFAWQEFLRQCWFITRVCIAPAVLLSIPFTVLAAFTFNILLVDFGAADLAGSGTGIVLAQLGPVVTVLVVAGSSARMADGCKDTPVDQAIVGIVDTISLDTAPGAK